MAIKHYDNINELLEEIEIPLMTNQWFYLAKFDETSSEHSTLSYSHDYFEVAFSIGYDAQVSINDKTSNVLDFNLSFISPGQVVTWNELNDAHPQSIGFMLLFKPEFLPFASSVFNIYENFPYFNNNTLSSFQLNSKQKELFLSYFNDLYQEYNAPTEDSFEIIKFYLSILLLKAKRELQFSKGISYLKKPKPGDYL